MRRLLFPLVLLAVAAFAAPSHGETVASECVALGWQVEHADAAVVAVVVTEAGPGPKSREFRIRVEDAIRGGAAVGDVLTVVYPDAETERPPTAGTRCLAFLDAVPQIGGFAAPTWRPVSGPYGVRRVPDAGPEARFPGLARSIAGTLDARGQVKDPAALRTLLVTWMEDADPGIAWGAATDFVRHQELHDGLAPDEGRRIVDAYRRCPIGKMTKHALALACAMTRHPDAARALVDSLLLPGAGTIRSPVGDALRRLRAPGAEDLVTEKLAAAGTPERVNLLVALGAFGREAAVPAARRSLLDAAPTVRLEAAHAMGRVARNVRDADPAARIDARDDLARVLEKDTDPATLRASLWALAQLDDPAAWVLLRKLAADDPREDVRRYAERYLKSPRQSFVLE